MKRTVILSIAALFWAGMAVAQGSITVDGAAAHSGDFGMLVNLTGQGDKAYVEESDAHQSETVYRAKFWFNPNRDRNPADGNFPAGNAHVIFQAVGPHPGGGAGNVPIVAVELRRYGSLSNTVRVRLFCYYDNQNSGSIPGRAKRLSTKMQALQPDKWNQLQVELQTSSSNVTGEVDGLCRLSVIDGPASPKTGQIVGAVKNARHAITAVRMGAIFGVDDNTVGDFYYDDFESFRTLAP
jgi:hypothetical protein